MSRLRLGVVCYPTIGGSSVIATEIATAAARQGHDVHLLSYRNPSRLTEAVPGLVTHLVKVSGYPLLKYPPYDLALATRMLEVQERFDIDLFHVHYAIPHAVSAFLARSMSEKPLRFVTTLHGTDITVVGADPSYLRPTRFAIEQSNAVTAVSNFLSGETARVFNTQHPIEVIPNFVDTARFQPGAKGPYYRRQNKERIIVHGSNFRPVKRVADVIRVFGQLTQRLPCRLLLAGDGPDREHALAVAADLGCLEQIEVLGNRSSLDQILADADLCLMASETESFGLVLLEAMSCGVPCVSTNVGGVREVLGQEQYLRPVGQIEELADVAFELLTQEDRHHEVSQSLRQRAIESFDRDAILEQYMKLYQEVLAVP